MDIDENLIKLERSIKILLRRIESISKKSPLQKYNKIQKIKLHPSQLPFEYKILGSLDPKEIATYEEKNKLTQTTLLQSNLNIWQNKLRNAYKKKNNWRGGPANLIAFPNLNGHFIYDAVNDLYTIDEVEASLWGWDMLRPVRYADVLASVANKEKFMEETLGHCKSYNVTSPIQIKNGSVVREELTYHFHPEDYEGRSLLKINGTTELLKIV